MNYELKIKKGSSKSEYSWLLELIHSADEDLVVKIEPDNSSAKSKAIKKYWVVVRMVSKELGVEMDEVDMMFRNKYAERIVDNLGNATPAHTKEMAPAALFNYLERCITFCNTELNLDL